jgi:predicted permease
MDNEPLKKLLCGEFGVQHPETTHSVMGIPYRTAIEILCSNYIIVALGALCARLKRLGPEHMFLITRVTTYVSIPSRIFLEIGQNFLNLSTFSPLLVGILCQITLHLLIGLVLLFIPSEHRILDFLRIISSVAYSEYLYFGAPIIHTIFGEEYAYVCVQLAVVLYVLVYSLHSLAFSFFDRSHESVESHSGEHAEEEELEDGIDRTPGPIHPVEPVGSSRDALLTEEEEEERHEVDRKKLPWIDFLSVWLVSFVLGLIWAGIGWKMPVFLKHVTQCHARALMAPGIAAVGVYIYAHPLFGDNRLEIGFCLVMKLVGMPLIAVFWCYLLRLEAKVASSVVLLHAMPMGMLGYDNAMNRKMRLMTPTFTFVWSNLLAMPVLMLWIALINETGLFGGV